MCLHLMTAGIGSSDWFHFQNNYSLSVYKKATHMKVFVNSIFKISFAKNMPYNGKWIFFFFLFLTNLPVATPIDEK